MSPRPQFPNEREENTENRSIAPIIPEIAAAFLLVITAGVVFFVSFSPSTPQKSTDNSSTSQKLTEAERQTIEERLAQSATSTLTGEERAEVEARLSGNSDQELTGAERRAIEQKLSE